MYSSVTVCWIFLKSGSGQDHGSNKLARDVLSFPPNVFLLNLSTGCKYFLLTYIGVAYSLRTLVIPNSIS